MDGHALEKKLDKGKVSLADAFMNRRRSITVKEETKETSHEESPFPIPLSLPAPTAASPYRRGPPHMTGKAKEEGGGVKVDVLSALAAREGGGEKKSGTRGKWRNARLFPPGCIGR